MAIKLPPPKAAAVEFSRIIRAWLTPAEMEKVIARVADIDDFCDSNMALLGALQNLVPGYQLGLNEAETALFDAMWDIALHDEYRVEVTGDALTAARDFFCCFAGKKRLVHSMAEGAAKYVAYLEEHDFGASDAPVCMLKAGRDPLYEISYNGRVWINITEGLTGAQYAALSEADKLTVVKSSANAYTLNCTRAQVSPHDLMADYSDAEMLDLAQAHYTMGGDLIGL